MAKCVYCGINEVEGKAKTCSSKCRMALSRSVTVNVTNDKCNKPTVTDEQRLFEDWQDEIKALPIGVVKPRWRPSKEPTCWQESRRYFETIVRLFVYNVAELEEMGVQFIPSWKYKAEGYFEAERTA